VKSVGIQYRPIPSLMPVEQAKSVVLVTGGTGLVGYAIQHIIDTEPVGSRFGRREGEAWIFLSSKDADLRFVSFLFLSLRASISYLSGSGIQCRRNGFSISIDPRTSFISPPLVRCASPCLSWVALCNAEQQSVAHILKALSFSSPATTIQATLIRTVILSSRMRTHPPVSGKTYREKALGKFKQQPIVPVGAPSLTVAC